MSQGYEILPPKSGQAYPIPCEEWDMLKAKVQRIESSPSFFDTAGGILAGAALSTFITIIVGTFNDPGQEIERAYAWAVVVACCICAALCYYFSYREAKTRRVQTSEIISQMELIEHRYKTKNESTN